MKIANGRHALISTILSICWDMYSTSLDLMAGFDLKLLTLSICLYMIFCRGATVCTSTVCIINTVQAPVATYDEGASSAATRLFNSTPRTLAALSLLHTQSAENGRRRRKTEAEACCRKEAREKPQRMLGQAAPSRCMCM